CIGRVGGARPISPPERRATNRRATVISPPDTERSTTMTTEGDMTLVFTDAAGEDYLLPLATLKQGQVPAEKRAEIERLISEQQDDGQSPTDTSGFRFSPTKLSGQPVKVTGVIQYNFVSQ